MGRDEGGDGAGDGGGDGDGGEGSEDVVGGGDKLIASLISLANTLQPFLLRCRLSFQYKLRLSSPELVVQWQACSIYKKPSFQQTFFKISFVCWIFILLLEIVLSLGKIPTTITFR